MASVNKVFLIGHLGQDPELKTLPTGNRVARISLATGEKYTDRDNKLVEKTEWHRVVFWNKSADIASQYLKKGKKIFVEGKIVTNSWEDESGVKRYTTEIHASRMTMLDRMEGAGRSPQDALDEGWE